MIGHLGDKPQSLKEFLSLGLLKEKGTKNKLLLTQRETQDIKFKQGIYGSVIEPEQLTPLLNAIKEAQLSKVLDAGYEKLPKYDDDIVENLKRLIYTEIIDWATKEGMTDKVLDSIVRREIIPLANTGYLSPEEVEAKIKGGLDSLSAELEKLTVLGDEQLRKAVWGEWNAEHLRVAEAQLNHTEKEIRELLE